MGSFSADLDHVAVATTGIDAAKALAQAGAGGREIARFTERSWTGLQMAFDGGIRLEFLEPIADPADDFLDRFLERHGQAPHHLTFKVGDLAAALEGLAEIGIEPLKVDMGDPNWKEAFLHPRVGVGTVVQLAEAHGQWASYKPEPIASGDGIRSELLGVELRSDAQVAERLFEGLLGGERRAVEGGAAYSWPGGGTVVVRPAGEARPALETIVWRILEWPAHREPSRRQAPLYGGPATVTRLGRDEAWPRGADRAAD